MNGVEVFSNKTALHLDPNCFSTFIQMDKPNYSPGQVVRIRVVSIKPDWKPNNGPVDIAIRVSGGLTGSNIVLSAARPVRRVSTWL